MDARDYMTRAGLTVSPSAIREAQTSLWDVLEEAKKTSLPATPTSLNRLYQFRVPKLSPDGSCSLHDELDPVPYDLTQVLGGRTVDLSVRLLTLNSLVTATAKLTQSDWLGIYQARTFEAAHALVKLASVGIASRAEFPLTEAFAQHSNNSAVGRSGRARVLNDLRAHRDQGGAYYECDPRVQAEACLPLFSEAGAVIGIIDAEAASAGVYDEQRLGILVALALEAPNHLPETFTP
jgi:putative methionine-R-sulfoxide reductase with GAF domain